MSKLLELLLSCLLHHYMGFVNYVSLLKEFRVFGFFCVEWENVAIRFRNPVLVVYVDINCQSGTASSNRRFICLNAVKLRWFCLALLKVFN